MQKLDAVKFGLAWGITCGLCFMVFGWLAMTGWGAPFVALFSSAYIGYSPSIVGGVIGGIWAFFDWGIGFGIAAWIYNWLLGKGQAQ